MSVFIKTYNNFCIIFTLYLHRFADNRDQYWRDAETKTFLGKKSGRYLFVLGKKWRYKFTLMLCEIEVFGKVGKFEYVHFTCSWSKVLRNMILQ